MPQRDEFAELCSRRNASGRICYLQRTMPKKKRVAIIGSGNWGCAIAKIVGQNCARVNHLEEEVRMWVFEEMVQGRKLTDIINEDHHRSGQCTARTVAESWQV